MYIIPVVCDFPPIAPALLHPRQALWSRNPPLLPAVLLGPWV